MSWHPTATIETLKQRANIIAKIRAFFATRGVLEVDTPLLSHASVTDLHLHSFETKYLLSDAGQTETLYLQTSPEYAMKRLLAAGSGAIYQICKSFRNNGETGRFHNPEFTMLEWYRPGFDHHKLMDEMNELLKQILECNDAERLTYHEIFQRYFNINPHTASIEELKNLAIKSGISIDHLSLSQRDDWLMLLMSHVIEPQLGLKQPTFIYDFPATQAALAKIRQDNPPVAERFEVYIQGIELANGFHELSDSNEQRQRFINDLQKRCENNYSAVPVDENLLAALQHGLPDCAGVALGIDRLIMLALKQDNIKEIISFPVQRA